MVTTPARCGPWRRGDVKTLALGNFAGLVVIAVAWYGAAQGISPADQSAEIALAIGGLALAGLGNAYWVAAARRSVTRYQRLAETGVRSALAAADRTHPTNGSRPSGEAVPGDGFVANAQMAMYHRERCPLVAGKQVECHAAAAHQRAGRRPCGVCRP